MELTNNRKFKTIILLLSVTIISFLATYVSEWTREFLGYIGYGIHSDGIPVDYKVAWLRSLRVEYTTVHKKRTKKINLIYAFVAKLQFQLLKFLRELIN